jgi:hypothetical protein
MNLEITFQLLLAPGTDYERWLSTRMARRWQDSSPTRLRESKRSTGQSRALRCQTRPGRVLIARSDSVPHSDLHRHGKCRRTDFGRGVPGIAKTGLAGRPELSNGTEFNG